MENVSPCLLWLRRDLRAYDHTALFHALQTGAPVQPVFVFDSDILADFPHKRDRRLSFIARALCALHMEYAKRGGGVLVLYGKASEVIPRLAQALGARHIIAAEDYEPKARQRDAMVENAIFVKDQVIFAAQEIVKEDGTPYKVYTPYANRWRAMVTPLSVAAYGCEDRGHYADYAAMRLSAQQQGLEVLEMDAQAMLARVGYALVEDALWPVTNVRERLRDFMAHNSSAYGHARDMMGQEGTSRLSPYIRFGRVSIRECVAAAMEAGAGVWLGELIWREFYAMILYHFPESAAIEWNPKYRGVLNWSENEAHFQAWQEGKTGYPLVDAAMRQLLEEGWMHNRARMVVASFLTKHLRIDWRRGEAHFAQYLMDYDMASNVGGWQWAASTGTDAQPYFRVFSPMLQSARFDPKGDYIKRYVPELQHAPPQGLHAPWEHPLLVRYIAPIVDHASARLAAIAMFKNIGG
jgi:deoxyribodipyrimidine photo-lyase